MRVQTIILSAFWFMCFVFFASAQTQYNLIEPLPGIQSVKDFPDFISRFIPFLLAFAALAAFVQIVFGGILRATSGGNPSTIGDANDRIWQAILGLVLALSAYLILKTINPDLVSLRFLVPKVEIAPSEVEKKEAEKMIRGNLNKICSGNQDCGEGLTCKQVKFGNEFIFQCRP